MFDDFKDYKFLDDVTQLFVVHLLLTAVVVVVLVFV